MAEPAVSVNTGLSAAGVGAQLGGSIVQAIEAGRIGRYNEKVARANAQAQAFADLHEAQQQERLALMIQDELTVIDAAEDFQLARLGEQTAQAFGMAEAVFAASGLALEGSPLAVLEAGERQATLERLTVQYQSALQRRAVQEQQTQATHAATMARFAAGERLRLGSQQAGLVRMDTTSRQVASALDATGQAVRGAQIVNFLSQRQRASRAGLTPEF